MTECPKCHKKNDKWSKCEGACPFPDSPHFDATVEHIFFSNESPLCLLLKANHKLSEILKDYPNGHPVASIKEVKELLSTAALEIQIDRSLT